MSSQWSEESLESQRGLIPGEILEPQMFLGMLNKVVEKYNLPIRKPLMVESYWKYGHMIAFGILHAEPDTVASMLVHSKQNGVEWGMDVDYLEGRDTLLKRSIALCHYDLFKTLLLLNANPFGLDENILEGVVHIVGLTNFVKIAPDDALETRRNMLVDLLRIGVPVTKEVMSRAIRYGHPSFLCILSESASGKVAVSSKMLRDLMEDGQVQHSLSCRDDTMRTEVMALYNKLRVKESLESDKVEWEALQEKAVELTTRKAMEKFALSPAFAAQMASQIFEENSFQIRQNVADQLAILIRENPQRIIDMALWR